MRPRIVTGGQTGVDRGALDAALEAGAACGGWCPQGRRAEDGAIPARYPLAELPGGDNAARTCRNVADSDGTLVLMFANHGSGTLLTVRHAAALNRPLLVIDAGTTGAAEAAALAREFIESHDIGVLNVGGPRASEEPRAQAYARAVIRAVLQP